MSTYSEETEKQLIGRTIVKADVDGFGIRLVLDDGSRFEYDASDGGYSSWEIENDGKGAGA